MTLLVGTSWSSSTETTQRISPQSMKHCECSLHITHWMLFAAWHYHPVLFWHCLLPIFVDWTYQICFLLNWTKLCLLSEWWTTEVRGRQVGESKRNEASDAKNPAIAHEIIVVCVCSSGLQWVVKYPGDFNTTKLNYIQGYEPAKYDIHQDWHQKV